MNSPPDNTLILPSLDKTRDLASRSLKLSKKLVESVKYSAHLSKMLYEACSLLEKLEISVDTSEELAHWWEREKRRTDGGRSDYANIYQSKAHLGNSSRTGVDQDGVREVPDVVPGTSDGDSRLESGNTTTDERKIIALS